MYTFVKASTGQVLPVGRKCHTVDGLFVAGEGVQTRPPLHVPQPHCGVEGSAGEDQVHVGVGSARPSGAPLDGVDLLLVGLEVVQAGVLVHAPDLECHVVAAASQELALGVPLDGVYLVGVALEGLYGFLLVELAHVDLLVG